MDSSFPSSHLYENMVKTGCRNIFRNLSNITSEMEFFAKLVKEENTPLNYCQRFKAKPILMKFDYRKILETLSVFLWLQSNVSTASHCINCKMLMNTGFYMVRIIPYMDWLRVRTGFPYNLVVFLRDN